MKDDDLYEAKITKSIKGKKIKKVVVPWIQSANLNDEYIVSKDMGEIFIVLEDGTVLKCWTSEWGGISYGKLVKNKDFDYINFKSMSKL